MSLFIPTQTLPKDLLQEDLEELITKIIRISLGDISILDIQFLPYAFTNISVLLTLDHAIYTKIVLKIGVKPNRETKFISEAEIIERIETETDLPVPHIIAKDFSRTKVPYPFILYTYLPGINLIDIVQSTEDKSAIGIELAKLTAKLHNIHYLSAQSSLANKESIDTWEHIIHGIMSKALMYLKESNYKDIEKLEQYIEQHISLIQEPKQYSLIHRDLQPQNIHWDEKAKRIVGIFDFEAALVGDFHYEFCYFERKLFKEYPEIKQAFYTEYEKHTPLQANYVELVKFYCVIRDLLYYQKDIEAHELGRAQSNLKDIENNISQ